MESTPVPLAASLATLLLTLSATCWQNLPPPVATTFDVVSLGSAAAAEELVAAAVEALAVFFFAAQPLSRPTTVSAARAAVPTRCIVLVLTCVSPGWWIEVPATGRLTDQS